MLEIRCDGNSWLRGNLTGSLTQIQNTDNSILFNLTNNTTSGWLEWTDKRILEANLDGKALVIDNDKIQVPVNLSKGRISVSANADSAD